MVPPHVFPLLSRLSLPVVQPLSAVRRCSFPNRAPLYAVAFLAVLYSVTTVTPVFPNDNRSRNDSSVSSAETVPGRNYFPTPAFSGNFFVQDQGKQSGFLTSPDTRQEQNPFWGIAQHHSRFNVAVAPPTSPQPRQICFSDQGKSIILDSTDSVEPFLRLDVHGQKEYPQPRHFNEPWVHLLLFHNWRSTDAIPIATDGPLTFSIDLKVNECQSCLSPEEEDPAIHCAQATAYFTINNQNHDSPDFNDYIWLGFPVFDSRYEVPDMYVAVDGDPKTIGTGKLIYTLGGPDAFELLYGGRQPNNGDWVHLQTDLRRHAADALKAAQSRGFLTQTEISDLRVTHFNLGWEVTGTFECSLSIRNPRLTESPSTQSPSTQTGSIQTGSTQTVPAETPSL